MPNWKKVITSGSDATLNSLTVTSGVTGSLYGTSSYAITASYISPTFISASAAASGFGSGAGSSVSASYAATASYITITNDVDTRLTTANGNGTLNAESLLTFDGTKLSILYQSGDEGGEILLGKPATNNSLTGSGITIDSYQNKIRFFEQGGAARGAYIDLTACAGGVGTNLLTGGSGISLNGGTNVDNRLVTATGTSPELNGESNLTFDGTTLTVVGNVSATSLTGSLFGTASFATTATTASYVLQSISASFAATASSVNTLNQNVIVNGAVTSSYILVSGSGGNVNRLLVVGSGSNTPLFTVQGSQGELFSITDSLSGSLFSVNDISGLPVLEAFSDGIINFGSVTAPGLLTTVKVTSVAGNNTIYSIPTASYDGVWFDYTIKSGSNARAGQIMSIWGNGGNVRFTETTTTDIGSTSGVNFTSILSGANLLITGSTSTANWTIKGIVRSI